MLNGLVTIAGCDQAYSLSYPDYFAVIRHDDYMYNVWKDELFRLYNAK